MRRPARCRTRRISASPFSVKRTSYRHVHRCQAKSDRRYNSQLMDCPPPITIRRAAAEEVVDLRHAILRAGLPRETAIFPGDDDPTARHFVAVMDGQVVGTLT